MVKPKPQSGIDYAKQMGIMISIDREQLDLMKRKNETILNDIFYGMIDITILTFLYDWSSLWKSVLMIAYSNN